MKIIYHSRDLDGYCSGAILKKRFPQAELIGYDYGQAIPKIDDGDEIIMVDVSIPMLDMATMAMRCKLTWIDHHISAINDFGALPPNKITAVLDNAHSACEGAWRWAFPDRGVPLAVTMLGMYDTWRNHDKDWWDLEIMPFQYGMRTLCHSAESFPEFMLESDVDLQDIIQLGAVILRYQKDQYMIAAKSAFEFDWKGYRCIALNGGGFNSMAFDSVYDEAKHDIMMPFKFNGKMWIFSLYTTKDIDCSAIAKEMGGGGHKKAAGFQVETLAQMGFRI